MAFIELIASAVSWALERGFPADDVFFDLPSVALGLLARTEGPEIMHSGSSTPR